MQLQYETDHLILRVLDERYASNVLDFYQNNKEFFNPWEPAHHPNFYTIPYQKILLGYEYKQILEKKFVRYYIFKKSNPNEIIGSICFQNIIRGPYQSCSIGYKIAKHHTHHHYALEAIQKTIDIIFQDYQLHRIDAYILPDNYASLSLIQKLGFQKEGITASFIRLDDSFLDCYHFVRINSLT